MAKSVISEGKTTQEAIEKGLKEIKLPKELCEIKVLEENKKSFFDILAPKIVRVEIKEIEARKPEEIEIETTEEELNIAKKDVEEFLNEFLNKISPEARATVEIKDKCLYISINGENIGNLIGYRGETLNAFQTILSSFVSNHTKHHIKVILDIGDDKEKRKNTLENLAVRTANNVIRTGKSITLEPMHPYERKIIHSKLQENNKVKTHSVGEEPYRKVVISLTGKKV